MKLHRRRTTIGNVEDGDAHVFSMQGRENAAHRQILALLSPPHAKSTPNSAWSWSTKTEAPVAANSTRRGTASGISSHSFKDTPEIKEEKDEDVEAPILDLTTPSLIRNRNPEQGRVHRWEDWEKVKTAQSVARPIPAPMEGILRGTGRSIDELSAEFCHVDNF